MSVLAIWASGLAPMLALALLAWAVAAARANAGLVDIAWSLFFLLGGCAYAWSAGASPRALLVLALLVPWSLRLAGYLAARNWGAQEDRRYRDIRARNQPGFVWKSLYLVFGLQALLAWLISAPLAAAIASDVRPGPLDVPGALLVVFGLVFEAVADAQLARFRSDPLNSGQVMDSGLWRYSRHPNYFGEACVWWGFWLIAFAAGAWWTLFAPLLMTVLLLRVSGVALLEQDIGERRPAYANYVLRTNAFLPGPRRTP